MEGLRKMKYIRTDKTRIKLNWKSFKIHVSHCEKCQIKCLEIWSHIHQYDYLWDCGKLEK